jgi:dimethylargininase
VRIALTRAVSPEFDRCELTHLERQPIDLELARDQHRRYEECLIRLGCELLRLPPEPDLPDSVFVEDTAIVLDEVAVITRPGAASRRAEIAAVAEVLATHRELFWIEAPATLDGGDVLRFGRTLWVGLSGRSSEAGIATLQTYLARFGYRVEAAPLTGCLHLKSAVTLVGPETLLVNPRWVDPLVFGPFDRIEVDPEEPHAANALLVGDVVVYPSSHRRTRERLERRGLRVAAVDVTEIAKAEGGVTCCSLIFESRSG